MNKNKAFTLSEVLVYVSLIIVVALICSSFLLWISRSNNKSKAMRETLDNSRKAMELITHEIKEAVSVYTPTSVFSSSNGQLSLETSKYLPGGETYSYIDFFLCGTRICLKKENQSPIAITSEKVEITSLEFSQIATTSTVPSIQIALSVNYLAPSAKPEYQFSIDATSTASLRNY